ncbi:MAG TPA: plastocyanin/azurin family copper-binding protein [Nitrososphaeraceae archaeon]|nr:plastocyanin/azurin family copper-binding protein [Nitrososphaeraceae archaeon]
MKKALTLSITIIIMSVLTIGLLSNPSISSAADISLVNKVFAQESEEVFIVPGAFDPNNDEGFVPPEISVSSEGNIVSWTNDDSTEHTVTADDGSFDSGPISPGDTFDNTFDAPGDFGYHCSIHPFMTGVVVVE